MKEKPILFSGPMVRAILEGRKTQTRRVVKPQPSVVHEIYRDGSISTNLTFRKGDQRIHCPFGSPGDRLWVRETWRPAPKSLCIPGHNSAIYAADDIFPGPWKPSIHMPRWASRITLEIVSVRVERLQDISEDDAKAEGCDGNCPVGYIPAHQKSPSVYHFHTVWSACYGPESWEANPWVWVVEFKEVK